MSVDIHVPEMGESVVEATVGEWQKKEGDVVNVGDILVELETDKVDVEVGAESSGVLVKITAQSGEDVAVGDVLGTIDPNGSADNISPDGTTASSAESSEKSNQNETTTAVTQPSPPPKTEPAGSDQKEKVTPVAKRIAAAEGIDVGEVSGSGAKGRITKRDVEQHLNQKTAVSQPAQTAQPTITVPEFLLPNQPQKEERIRMSRRRRTIASRLVEAQQTAAMLTTFNEIDMSAVISLRKRRQDAFVEKFGIKVGFTSFFVKATIGALKAFPRLNAEIDGDEMVIKNYYDIGIAVGAEEGLVVPVIRDANQLNFAEIEHQVKNYAQKSREGTLSLDDLRGGTFTITNGGVFGSMLSTPILNPPQVGILGLHNIVQRPIAIEGEVVIRPIMYVALTYDHRIVDGREAVQFLVKVKQLIEDPEQLLLEG